MKALGLFSLNLYSKMDIIGVMGSSMVEMMISGGRRIIFFALSNCHFIFMLFTEGNMVSAVV